MTSQQVIKILGLIAAFGAVAVAGWQVGALALRAGPVEAEVGVTYKDLSFEEMATAADLVVAGQIAAISPTRWNQDSGEFWEDTFVDGYGRQVADTALPYYEVTVAAQRTLVDGAGLDLAPGAPVVFTVIGQSPAAAPGTAGVLVSAGHADGAIDLAVGSPAVVFARRADMAWRGGTRAILQPLGNPAAAVVAVEPGQLDALADKLAGLRDPVE